MSIAGMIIHDAYPGMQLVWSSMISIVGVFRQQGVSDSFLWPPNCLKVGIVGSRQMVKPGSDWATVGRLCEIFLLGWGVHNYGIWLVFAISPPCLLLLRRAPEPMAVSLGLCRLWKRFTVSILSQKQFGLKTVGWQVWYEYVSSIKSSILWDLL